jgi:hypothetical protein
MLVSLASNKYCAAFIWALYIGQCTFFRQMLCQLQIAHFLTFLTAFALSAALDNSLFQELPKNAVQRESRNVALTQWTALLPLSTPAGDAFSAK